MLYIQNTKYGRCLWYCTVRKKKNIDPLIMSVIESEVYTYGVYNEIKNK